MFNAALIWEILLVVGAFSLGTLTTGIVKFFKPNYNPSGSITLRRKGSDETITIPPHYDVEKVDKLLRQLKSSS